MNPTNENAAQLVLKELEDIWAVIDEVTDKAVTSARDFFEQRGEPVNTYLFPCLVRYFAKMLLDQPKYRSAGYYVVEISNNGLFLIILRYGKTRKIRILKADEEGAIPLLNLSKKKKEFFRQPNPFPSLPGMGNLEIFAMPDSMHLVVLWNVDRNYVFTPMQLVCPNGEFGEVHFADIIPHSATRIPSSESFDEEPEELEDIDIEPLEKTGSDENNEDDGESNR